MTDREPEPSAYTFLQNLEQAVAQALARHNEAIDAACREAAEQRRGVVLVESLAGTEVRVHPWVPVGHVFVFQDQDSYGSWLRQMSSALN